MFIQVIAVAGLLAGLLAVPGPVEWRSCGSGRPPDMRCSSVEVPVDWARPGGRRVSLPVATLPHTGAGPRLGVVFSVPGGPGGSGLEDFASYAESFAHLRERFDVVTFAPRNAGALGVLPRECFTTGPWLTRPDSGAAYDALGVTVAAAVRRCRDHDPEFFDHLDSASVARDIDAVRAALGERRLSFVATSYGGVPAVAYARLFPGRVRAMYLDGAVNQLRRPLEDALSRYATYERQFRRFAEWCDASAGCPLKDTGRRWRALIAAADRAPIRVKGEVAYSGFDLQVAAMPHLVSPGPDHARRRQLAQAIVRAESGDATGFAAYVEAGTGSPKPSSYVAMNATHCADGLRFLDYGEYRAVRALGERVAPDLPGMGLWHRLGCVGWPPAANPVAPLPATGLPPFLGAGTWTDHDDTADIVRRVPGSSTVRFDGPGHGLYLTGNACVIGYADAYLEDLRLPPRGTVCPGVKG
ncbi:MAG: alpha/beta fold hydrolase [Thermoactinospora sp.]|nr:alpha/beta fold hydrolase [Thermoactinospora sp.]